MLQDLKYIEINLGKRIYHLLKMIDPTGFDSTEGASYTESLLSQEIKAYFAYLSARDSGEGTDRDSPLYQACRFFALDDFEKMCLELSVLRELNPYFEKFFIYMNNDWNSSYLTPDTAVRLYTLDRECEPELYTYFAEEGKLCRFFFHIYKTEEKSWIRWGMRCRSAFLFVLLSGQFRAGVEEGLTRWYEREEGKGNGPVLFDGERPIFQKLDKLFSRKATLCLGGIKKQEGIVLLQQYAELREQKFCFLNIRRLAELQTERSREEMQELYRDISMQAMWQKSCICIYELDRFFLEKEQNAALVSYLAEFGKEQGLPLIFLGEEGCLEAICADIWEISLEEGEDSADAMLWKQLAGHYPVEEDVSLELFANTYEFTFMQLEQLFRRAERKRILQGKESISQKDLRDSCIRQTKSEGNHLLTVVDTEYSMEDLVLPEMQIQALETACKRVQYKDIVYEKWGFRGKMPYGRGVIMLFSGPPGTGKTMSAGIVANTLGAALYRVNLASVVSKYIGETEKNLQIIFEAVERGRGVLFFDEADVLFGQRTKVKDANDKHSNMEAAYLLQKMEEYEGVVILASNYIQNMDEAFKRRIPFLIEFPFPDAEQRKRIWEKVFPKQMEFEEEPDYDFLAGQFELSGSHIKNIALQAAFFAAEQEQGVKMEHIIQALAAEMKKTGRRISCEDLQEYSIYY